MAREVKQEVRVQVCGWWQWGARTERKGELFRGTTASMFSREEASSFSPSFRIWCHKRSAIKSRQAASTGPIPFIRVNTGPGWLHVLLKMLLQACSNIST